jgi:ABC-type transporter MlaC component
MYIEAAKGPWQDWRPANPTGMGEEKMKCIVMAVSFVAALSIVQALSPAHAQTTDEIKRICYNKYNLGKYGATASEAQRKDFAAKYAACVRSKGKS